MQKTAWISAKLAGRRAIMKKNTAKNVTVNALSIALVCIATMAIQIPIPLGYMHLGNTCILLTAALFGPVTGLLAGGIGSALADMLTGYPQWIIPTLIIKSIMGFAIGAVVYKKGSNLHMISVRTLTGSVAGIAIMIFGYFVAGAIMNGSIYTGWTQVPGLTLEGIIGMAIFYALGLVLEKANVVKVLNLEN